MVDSSPLPVDPDEIFEKYKVERAKRMTEGRSAVLKPSGHLESVFDDPGHPRLDREPVRDVVDVVILGGGFSGLQVAANLRKQGMESIRVIDTASDFGGTWYWNKYPGAQCDIESYIYLPLLEETGYIPKEKYSRQPEILEYCRFLARHFDLYEKALFQTKATSLEWIEAQNRWRIRTDRDDDMHAQYVVVATGPLSAPKLPTIPGIEDFAGHLFHTSRWDYDYTGGGSNGGLTELADKRVGIIGTGATAIQVVPHLGASSGRLYVFQRTPSTVAPRNNRPTDPEWASTLEPGWQRRRRENFAAILGGRNESDDLVSDGWTEAAREIFIDTVGETSPDPRLDATEAADLARSERIRSRVDEVVQDHGTAESLKAYYPYFCKRPCFHDEYLKTFNLPQVELVDTDGRGVERVTDKGLVVNGEEFVLDCLVLATGFETGTVGTRQIALDITGVNGQRLEDKWADGMTTLYGMLTHGFPNLFLMPMVFTPGVAAQTARLANVSHILSEVADAVSAVIERCSSVGAASVDVTEEAERAWVDTVVNAEKNVDPDSIRSRSYQAKCTPGYFNNEGRPDALLLNDAPYGGTALQFFGLLRSWREDEGLPGLEFTRA